MKRPIHLLICIATIFAFVAAADAREPRRKSTQFPAAAPSPTPGASSAEISRFTSAHLEQILGPLDQKIELPRTELAQLRESFAKEFSKASLADRPKFQLGLAVCDAIAEAMNERNKAVVTNASATWPQQAAQLRQKINQLAAQHRAAEGH